MNDLLLQLAQTSAVDQYKWVLMALGLAFGFYMAWTIGANDVANAMGTSVGSGALTLKRAIIVAGILEFAGAVLVGQHVTGAIRKDILPFEAFTAIPDDYVFGMLASLLAAATWLLVATYFGLPVSTTHTLVGAVLGVGLARGVSALNLRVVVDILISWVVTLPAGALLSIVFYYTLKAIF